MKMMERSLEIVLQKIGKMEITKMKAIEKEIVRRIMINEEEVIQKMKDQIIVIMDPIVFEVILSGAHAILLIFMATIISIIQDL